MSHFHRLNSSLLFSSLFFSPATRQSGNSKYNLTSTARGGIFSAMDLPFGTRKTECNWVSVAVAALPSPINRIASLYAGVISQWFHGANSNYNLPFLGSVFGNQAIFSGLAVFLDTWVNSSVTSVLLVFFWCSSGSPGSSGVLVFFGWNF